MEISTEDVQSPPVTILKLVGEVDSASYLDVIDKVKALFEDGCRNLLLDLTEVSFMASAGLIALHSSALIMRGDEPPNPKAGWQALHSMSADISRSSKKEPHFKLLAPQPRIAKTLKMTGFDNLLEYFSDREAALQSFVD